MGDERDSSSSEEESEEETSTEEESGSENEEQNEKNNVEQEKETDQKQPDAKSEPEVKKEVSQQSAKLSVPSQENVARRPSSSYGQPRKMTHQRKQNLKTMMLDKARRDLKKEAEQQAEEKKAILEQRLEPLGCLDSMNQQELMDLCRDLNAKTDATDEQRYDLEVKVRKYDTEIEDLNQRINDLRGKFKRPPLRRVRMSADQMLRALLGSKHKVSMDLRSNLKAVKKEEVKKEDSDVKDWRENVEAKTGMGGKKAVFEGQ